jgi:hypothetical protein
MRLKFSSRILQKRGRVKVVGVNRYFSCYLLLFLFFILVVTILALSPAPPPPLTKTTIKQNKHQAQPNNQSRN